MSGKGVVSGQKLIKQAITTYPTPLSTTPALTDEATLDTAVDRLLGYLPIEMGGGYNPQGLFEILI